MLREVQDCLYLRKRISVKLEVRDSNYRTEHEWIRAQLEDMMHHTQDLYWNSYADKVAVVRFELNFRTDARAVLDFHCDNHDADEPWNLGSVLVLVGNAADAEAVTCAQYMKKTWPDSGLTTLQDVECGLNYLRRSKQPSGRKSALVPYII